MNKPGDLSDITTLEEAKDELKALRRIAKEFQYQAAEGVQVDAGDADKKKRIALRDNNKQAFKGGDTYTPVVVPKDDNVRALILSVVTTNILFRSCTVEEHSAIVDAFEPMTVAKDAEVIKRGDPGDCFYICETGHLDVYLPKDGKMEKMMAFHIDHGQSFGELALMYNTPRAATLVAHIESKLWKIARNTYKEIVIHYKHLRAQYYVSLIKDVVLHERKIGDVLRPDQLEQLAMSFEREVFTDGECIIQQGAPGDHFYIIEDGTVGVYVQDANGDNAKQGEMGRGRAFGDRALLSQEVRAASCIAQGATSCLSLGREDFIALMGTVDDVMVTDHHAAGPQAGTFGQTIIDMKLEDLSITATLGMGAFGSVKLCYYAPSQTYYALKCQSKAMIVENELEDHVLNEMHIMNQINDAFVAKLYSSMQDDRYLYFCMELLQGGELYAYMQGKGTLVERDCRFYAASVMLSLNAMHEKKIAYRDLKPENLVFDERGYIKLVDLGLAKLIPSGKSWTICGTPEYIAPEIILHEGHNHAVDCWALGVLIYEMMAGTTPFADADAMKVYQNILRHDIKFPTSFSRDCSDVVKKLLHAQQSKRFGTLKGGLTAAMKHKWLGNFNFPDLVAGKAKAPYVPKIASKDDTSNFGAFDEIPLPVSPPTPHFHPPTSHSSPLSLFLILSRFSLFTQTNRLPCSLSSSQPISPWTPDISLRSDTQLV